MAHPTGEGNVEISLDHQPVYTDQVESDLGLDRAMMRAVWRDGKSAVIVTA